MLKGSPTGLKKSLTELNDWLTGLKQSLHPGITGVVTVLTDSTQQELKRGMFQERKGFVDSILKMGDL